ncbi:MAG TPA: HAMP domain-containing histidine kinase [Candidatus Faeciplasma gallinarum]|uniref:histidine kinase n=1 Tax=Candidatus Faeciplasma gallinarum TaxID=2840799 RepID=A0A9D1JHW9_9FIRM|nr:HAMP domain-containing histidine kinase [Candidatus Faeciplasma gallinarum]
MKNLSIRLKITLWFAVALFVIVAITYVVILTVSNQVIQKTIRDTLLHTVEDNVDEVEFYTDISQVDIANSVDHFIMYNSGYLEVDDDFLDEVNDVYTALYLSDGTLMYGENPLAVALADLEFSDSEIRERTVNGELYYILDRHLTQKGLEDLWLRGVVSEHQGEVQMHEISTLSLIILPIILIAAVLGGYFIAKRMLRPIKQITNAAENISRGGDLKKRIELDSGKDELHRLADSFNNMIARLDESFEAERQFTSDVSHELRTPMSVIMAQCEYTLDEERTPQEYERALRLIRRQGRKMTKLINDMLDFVRLERRGTNYQIEKLNLSALVNSVCEDMSLIRERGISLEHEVEDEIWVDGNPALLSRLLSNLISNAYRYGKDDGHIKVRLKKSQDEVTLSVSDDGIGISREDKEKIFRRFYQADSSRTGSGTGLGLSMVKEIASFHGGSMSVESEPGKGSEFTFHLPVKE